MGNFFPPPTKETAKWGTYGKGGAEHCAGTCPEHQLRWKYLIDCDTEHLQAILSNQRHVVGTHYEGFIHEILKDRGVKPKKFSEKAAAEFERKVQQAMRNRPLGIATL